MNNSTTLLTRHVALWVRVSYFPNTTGSKHSQIFILVCICAGFQVLVQALEQLIKDQPSEKMGAMQLVWLYAIMLTATGVKLVLWIYCRSSRSKIVRAYAKV